MSNDHPSPTTDRAQLTADIVPAATGVEAQQPQRGERRERSGLVGAAGNGTPPEGSARFDPRPGASPARPPARRRARLALMRVDPWSVFVLSLLISIFLAVVLVVAVVVLHTLLDSLGVLDAVDAFARELQLLGQQQSLLGLRQVLLAAGAVAGLNIVLLTVLATLFAFLYNVCASLTGGVETVLAERE